MKKLTGLLSLMALVTGVGAWLALPNSLKAGETYKDPFAVEACTGTCIFIPCCPPEN